MASDGQSSGCRSQCEEEEGHWDRRGAGTGAWEWAGQSWKEEFDDERGWEDEEGFGVKGGWRRGRGREYWYCWIE